MVAHTLHWRPYLAFTYANDHRLPETYHCPGDQAYYNKNPNNGNRKATEASYGYNLNFLGAGSNDVTRFRFFRNSQIKHPTETLMVADSGHEQEDGWQAFVIRVNTTNQHVYARHGSFANLLWVDGHVSHWMVPQVNGIQKWWDRN